jgi:hypothetical protein
VISKNLHRRHLNEAQRAMVGDKIANMKEGRPAKTLQICRVSESQPDQPPTPPVSKAQAAKLMNVSERSIQRAHIVRTPPVLGAFSA